MHLARSRDALLNAIEGIYWTMIDAAQAAFVENKAFGALLSADPRVTERLDSGAIAKLMDPTEYCGLSATLAREAVQRVRERHSTR
jgi:adenylosuccinate lyase